MIVIAKSAVEVLADINALRIQATEISDGSTDYSTFILLKCIEVNEGYDLDRIAEIFEAFLVMKEAMWDEHKKEQEQGRHGQAGRKGQTRQ